MAFVVDFPSLPVVGAQKQAIDKCTQIGLAYVATSLYLQKHAEDKLGPRSCSLPISGLKDQSSQQGLKSHGSHLCFGFTDADGILEPDSHIICSFIHSFIHCFQSVCGEHPLFGRCLDTAGEMEGI